MYTISLIDKSLKEIELMGYGTIKYNVSYPCTRAIAEEFSGDWRFKITGLIDKAKAKGGK